MRRTARRWRTPPAITQGSEAFDGLAILDEVKGPLGFLLWQCARDATLWALADEEQRAGLFAAGAEARLQGLLRSAPVDVQLESPLVVLLRMAAAPEATRAEAVELACRHIAHWGDVHGQLAVAVAFAQAAALSVPGDAGAACAVGRLAKRRAEHSRAETWFRRAVALARQSGDWSSYAQGFAGLGELYMRRGSHAAARRFHLRALRAARRHSLRPVQGAALHDLFVIAAGANHRDDAERYARGAFEILGAAHPRLPQLAGDIARFWLERGYHAPALQVLESLLPHLESRDERLSVLAVAVRAAAGAAERSRFEQGWDEVWDDLAREPAAAVAGPALLELARGAGQLGEYERAERAAERAVNAIRGHGDARQLLAAESLLEAVRRGRAGRGRVEGPPRLPPPADVEGFASDLARALNAALFAS